MLIFFLAKDYIYDVHYTRKNILVSEGRIILKGLPLFIFYAIISVVYEIFLFLCLHHGFIEYSILIPLY